MIREHNTEQFVEIEEAFIPPSLYPQIRQRPDCPDLSLFPDGIYILGKWGFSQILGVSPTPQLDAIKEEQERSDNMPSRYERSRRRRLRDQPHEATKIWFHETFVPPSEYDEVKNLPGMPDLSEFPDGFYMLGYNNFSKIVGFFHWSQLERMKQINDILDQASENNDANTTNGTGGIEVLPILREDAPDRVDHIRGDNDLELPGSQARFDRIVSDAIASNRPPSDGVPTDNADEGREDLEPSLAAGPDTTIYRASDDPLYRVGENPVKVSQ